MKNSATLILMLFVSTLGLKAQTSIYAQNFSAFPPTGWTNVDNTPNNAGKWKRVTTAGPLFSTRTNGYAIFDSDGGVADDNKPEDASLTSGAINCSAFHHVAIEFQSLFSQYDASEGKFLVSNDNVNWTEFYSVTQSSSANPEIIQLNISSVAANQSTVYLRFQYTGNYDYFWAVDDIKVFQPVALDVALVELTNTRFVGLSDQTITGTIKNMGYENVNTATISYTDNGGSPVYQTLTNLNLSLFDTYNFSLSQKVVMNTPSLHAIEATVSAPNNDIDVASNNNTALKEITALSAIPEKNVLFEEFTTTPCGWCPAGHFIESQIMASAPYFIPVNVHAGFGTDGMTTTEASALATAFANGAPTATIDRVYFKGEERVAVSRGIWEDKTIERHTQLSPATVEATSTYSSTGRTLNVTVKAKFFGPVNGNFRINCYVIEDSVTGSGSGFNQSNYLSGQNGFQSYPAYSLPNPISGYQHRHVERYALGTTWGTASVIPSSTADGGVYEQTYSYTLPQTWNADRCSLVAFVHEYNSNAQSGKNEVFNVIELPLNGSATQVATPSTYVSGIEQVTNPISQLLLYPNPASDAVTLEFSLNSDAKLSYDVTNLLGQTVYSVPQVNLDKGGFKSTINTTDFANGIYMVAVKNNGKTVQTLKFVVSK